MSFHTDFAQGSGWPHCPLRSHKTPSSHSTNINWGSAPRAGRWAGRRPVVRGNKDGPRLWKGFRSDHCMGSGAAAGAEGPPELGLPQRHVGGDRPLPVNGKGNGRGLSPAECP